MISLETARKLKDAGLQWEPQMGDFMYNNGIIDCLDFSDMSFAAGYEDLTHQGDVGFIPRLDQLLAEIEKQGWTWMLYAPNNDGKYGIDVGKGLIYHSNQTVMADSPEEAAALALLWILE